MTESTLKLPNTLSRVMADIVETEYFNINDVCDSFQFLFSEVKLSQMITHRQRANVIDLLVNNDAPRWKSSDYR